MTQNFDARAFLGTVFMSDIESLVRLLDPDFRQEEYDFTLGLMTVYADKDGCKYGTIGLETDQIVPFSVTRWDPTVGSQRLVIVLPAQGNKPPKAIPLGAASPEAREAAKQNAQQYLDDDEELDIPAIELPEWDAREPRYVVVEFSDKDRRGNTRYTHAPEGTPEEQRRVKYTTRINGKLAMLWSERNDRRTPPVGVRILCRVKSEETGVIHLAPVYQKQGAEADAAYAAWNSQTPNTPPSVADGIKAEARHTRPRLSGSPFAGLGLSDDANFGQVKGTAKRLLDAEFNDEASALADPMFKAMRETEFNGSWITDGPWFKNEDFLFSRGLYVKEARDAAIRMIRRRSTQASPAPSQPSPPSDIKPPAKRQRRKHSDKRGEQAATSDDGSNGGSQDSGTPEDGKHADEGSAGADAEGVN